jgi:hypothetical protein
MPVAVFRVRPGGKVPALIEKVKGGTPGVATSERLYDVPTCPLADGPLGNVRLSVPSTINVPGTEVI